MDYHNPNKINIKQLKDEVDLDKQKEKERYKQHIIKLRKQILKSYLSDLNIGIIRWKIKKAIEKGKDKATIIKEDWRKEYKCLIQYVDKYEYFERRKLEDKYIKRSKLIYTPVDKILGGDDIESLYDKIVNIIPDKCRINVHYIYRSCIMEGFCVDICWGSRFGCIMM